MNFYEIDPVRGTVHQLSPLFCGLAPCGGEVIYAPNRSAAQQLWFRYRDGDIGLKGSVMIDGQDYPYRNIICEPTYHMREDVANNIEIAKATLPNQLKLFIADIVDEETGRQEF